MPIKISFGHPDVPIIAARTGVVCGSDYPSPLLGFVGDKLPNSVGVIGIGVAPRSANCSTLEWAKLALISTQKCPTKCLLHGWAENWSRSEYRVAIEGEFR